MDRLSLTLAAGLLSGNCMLPMRFVKAWPWEAVWLTFTIVSLILLPWQLAVLTVSNLSAVYHSLPQRAFVARFLFGGGWGIAQVLFGLSVTRLGLALGYAIIVGLGALLGTLVPLFVSHREVASTGRGLLILLGVSTMVLGIVVCARAGRQRENGNGVRAQYGSYGLALMLAVLCGLMTPMLNFAFAFGQSISERAVQHGASVHAAGYAVWPHCQKTRTC